MNGKSETIITDLDGEFLYCFPTGIFFADVESKILFFDIIASPEKNPIDNLIGRPAEGSSTHLIEYQADRGASAIVTSLGIDTPLYVFNLEKIEIATTKNLIATYSSFTLSRNGTICLCYNIEIVDKLKAGDAVEQLTYLRSEIKKDLKQRFKSAISNVESEMMFQLFKGVQVSEELITRWVKSFEIIDFDFKVGRRYGHTILRDYYSGKLQSLPTDLTGFIRMTRQGVWTNYKPDFQTRFWAQNLGNRKDEIWLVHVKHFFRFHPERAERESVQNFYSEVSLSIKKLIHSIAHINFLSRAMQDFRLTENSDWRSVLKFSDNLSEQAPQLPEYSEHDFFSRLMIRILEEFNFDSLTKNYHVQLGEIKASTLSYTSLLSAKRVNQLTYVVLVVTALQLLLSSEEKGVIGKLSGWFLSLLSFLASFIISIGSSRTVLIIGSILILILAIISNKRFEKVRLKIRLKLIALRLKKK